MSVRLHTRLTKLESNVPDRPEHIYSPIYLCDDAEKQNVVTAFVSHYGVLNRREDEPEKDFKKRVNDAEGKFRPAVEWSDEELEEALQIMNLVVEQACLEEGLLRDELKAE